MSRSIRIRLVFLLAATLSVCAAAALRASDVNDTCFGCHDDKSMEREDGTPVYVNPDVFLASVHKELDCTDCHQDVDPDDLPHAENLEKVHCADCHDDVGLDFEASIHGQALNRRAPYAPDCAECHGMHDIRPYLCGKCHREGAPVASTYDIGEHDIIENYSQSIHGEGLFKKGLTVTATCTSCHRAHLVLPHTDPRASISPRRSDSTRARHFGQIPWVNSRSERSDK